MSLPLPYYNDDKKSFAYSTVHKRWPLILEGGLKDVTTAIASNANLKQSGDVILEGLQHILQSLKNDSVVRPFEESEIALNADLKVYNHALDQFNQQKKVTWQTGPWLYLECYIYHAINNLFISSKEKFWHTFDIFEYLKDSTFKQSEHGVLELCKRYEALEGQLQDADDEALKLLFHEFIDISLWGNATDLSLLAGNVTLEDIKSVQGAAVRKKNEENILVNDLPQAWDQLVSKKGNRRIDIILDNSGFELFADLNLALFVLDSKLVHEVHIHCKEIPWFVSDTMPKDFENLLEQLDSKDFYQEIHANDKDSQAIKFLHSKLVQYRKSNQIVVESHPFWTLNLNFWEIPTIKDLYENLLNSDLIIFKGDLNYRKLTGDLQWEKTHPFKNAIQQLATSKLPVLSLRTCKADVVVGLPEGTNEKLIEKYKSMGNEVGEFWSSSGKWAVISFSNGRN
ncbi:DUF89-domain-containing protein [Suhomyces tanzawaensis NRRL Y-17324]|uniref:Sugar phosphate phosphatase n=1 Tax=Suhomyces tanzawaensis NRRL Y-17324 TaxID=984487 RepID=A0A1E4SQD7_9ASCO|nr:DUF89-domain-containing protein [Suhomyces tanzawaensis NRRL Y-17324]ODV81708.1 DUF89-domain-containing protein [Suhomyces tanzawaensis NRRL Y-17324]